MSAGPEVRRIAQGTLIPRDDGKRIEELVGAVHTGSRSVSVARMLAPPGWAEPAQTPEFDEAVVVLKGTLTVVTGRRRVRVAAGETGWVVRGVRVEYRNEGRSACEYLSVCAPAFRPELAHMEAPPEGRRAANRVEVDVRHPKGRPHLRAMKRDAAAFLRALGVGGRELSVTLVGDREIRRLNREWRRKDMPTDVLSFPAGTFPPGTPGPLPLGDVVISLDTAVRQAREYERTLPRELARYLAHGVLHLLGHDHEKPKDARKMAQLEAVLLGEPGMVPARR